MDIEAYVKCIKKTTDKFSEKDIEVIRGLLQQNIDLQKDTVGLRKKVGVYNERIKIAGQQKLRALAEEYARTGKQDFADSLMLVAEDKSFSFEPYCQVIGKIKESNVLRGKQRHTPEWEEALTEYYETGEQLKDLISELEKTPLFCKENPEYRFSVHCIERMCYVTMTHDRLDFYFNFERELNDFFTVGITFRDQKFQNAIEEMDREEFLAWYSSETIKEHKKWINLRDSYEDRIANEPDNQ